MGFYLSYLNTTQQFVLKYYSIHRLAYGIMKDSTSIRLRTALFVNTEDVTHECLNPYHFKINPEPYSPENESSQCHLDFLTISKGWVCITSSLKPSPQSYVLQAHIKKVKLRLAVQRSSEWDLEVFL